MPLWQLFTPENAYTREEKADMAKKIVDIYSSDFSQENFGFVLPKFYTSVIFHEIEADDFYVGGEPRNQFVQIEVVHIARTVETSAAKVGITPEESLRRYFARMAEVLKPYIADRGYEVEFHAEPAPFETWQIDGMVPPEPWSEDELRWAKDNRSSPYGPYETA
jgi:phenylpyruvate tautomerase PptA (4-oxalocrotonate tautomerase family)